MVMLQLWILTVSLGISIRKTRQKEKMTIYSIVNSLTELKEIDKVQFLIEGEKVKEFKGNFRFNNAFQEPLQLYQWIPLL